MMNADILSNRRSQTALDFLVGMSVFLLAVGFTFGFVPTMFEPFQVGAGGGTVVADRAAGHFVGTALAVPGTPAILDRGCTRDFFNASVETPPEDCNWTYGDGSLEALRNETGADGFTGMNVTIERGGTIRDLDGVTLDAGPAPPRHESITVSNRIVSIDGEEHRLKVRVW